MGECLDFGVRVSMLLQVQNLIVLPELYFITERSTTVNQHKKSTHERNKHARIENATLRFVIFRILSYILCHEIYTTDTNEKSTETFNN